MRRGGERNGVAADAGAGAIERDRHHVHARRANEIAHKRVLRLREQFGGRADLHDLAGVHDDDLVGEGQRFGLVVGDVDHGRAAAAVNLAQAGAELPFHLRVNDGERLVEQDGADIGAHEAAAERDLLLLIRREAACAAIGQRGEADDFEHLVHALADLGGFHAAIAERESEVLAHRHRVIDDGELEHLRDVALFGRQAGDVLAIHQHAAFARRLTRPEMMLSSEVLPQPDGPSSA